MDFRLYSGCLLLLVITDTFSTVYYAGNKKENYYNANTTCQNYSGQLLPYGMVFVNAMLKCQLGIYAWTGTPFYRQLEGCYKGNSSKQTPTGTQLEDTRVAVCADFCIDTNYTHFGIMTTECHCYTQDNYNDLDHANTCKIVSCPGNIYDICGVSPYATVFQKVMDYDITSCNARVVTGNGYSHEFSGYCLDVLPFLCKVGDSDDVVCSLQKLDASETSTSLSDYTTVYPETTSNVFKDHTVPGTYILTAKSEVSSTKPTKLPYDLFTNPGVTPDKTTHSVLADLPGTTTDKSTAVEQYLSSTFTKRLPHGTEGHTTTDFTIFHISRTKPLSYVSTDQTTLTTDISTSVEHDYRKSAVTDKMQTTYTRLYELRTISVTTDSKDENSGSSGYSTKTAEGSPIEQSSSSDYGSNVSHDATTFHVQTTYRARRLEVQNKQALIIGLSSTITVLVLMFLVIFVWKIRKRMKSPSKHKTITDNQNVYFINSGEEDTSIYYSSIRFNNLYDFSKSSSLNPFKLKEQMYDEESLVYDQHILDE